MTYFDVFNGDADGIISLVQLRRAAPREAELITGRKRDIELLRHVKAQKGDHVTVLDLSMRKNKQALEALLDKGVDIFYVDHHNAGDIPNHQNLTAIIDSSSEICTAMLVDSYLNGAYRAWAITAAFGDNFPKLAKSKAQSHDLPYDLPLEQLERLGMLINYNGYGASVEDLHFHPADLYHALMPFDTPMEFLAQRRDIFETLNQGYHDDLSEAQNAKILSQDDKGSILVLSNTIAARRISGLYGNQLAQQNPDKAHAILTQQSGGFLVSIRAPIMRRSGADILAMQFETGGGRSAAAGINHLSETDLPRFLDAFKDAFSLKD